MITLDVTQQRALRALGLELDNETGSGPIFKIDCDIAIPTTRCHLTITANSERLENEHFVWILSLLTAGDGRLAQVQGDAKYGADCRTDHPKRESV